MLKRLRQAALVSIAGLLIGVGVVYAQVTGIFGTSLNGNEAMRVILASGGGSGTEFFMTTGRITSGNSNVFFSAFPSSFTVGTVAGSVNTAPMQFGGLALINASNTVQTFTMPPNPVADGTIIGFCNVTGSAWATNAVTIAGNTGQTLSTNNTLTTLGAGSCGRYIWNLAQATWYRVQ